MKRQNKCKMPPNFFFLVGKILVFLQNLSDNSYGMFGWGENREDWK